MKISFACPGCGKSYAVDPSNAGRRGKCSGCGGVFVVPTAAVEATPPVPEPLPESDGYALGDLDGGSTAFTPAPGGDDLDPTEGRGEPASPTKPRKRKKAKSSVSEALDISWPKAPKPGQFARWRKPLIGLGVGLGLLVLLGLIFPALATTAGIALVVVGAVLLLVGMTAGAYTAFTEDVVHGFFYVVFWPYAAYYFVSRWEDMRLQLAAVLTGLVLLASGAKALEYAQWRQGSAGDAGPGAVETDEPTGWAPPAAIGPLAGKGTGRPFRPLLDRRAGEEASRTA